MATTPMQVCWILVTVGQKGESNTFIIIVKGQNDELFPMSLFNVVNLSADERLLQGLR